MIIQMFTVKVLDLKVDCLDVSLQPTLCSISFGAAVACMRQCTSVHTFQVVLLKLRKLGVHVITVFAFMEQALINSWEPSYWLLFCMVGMNVIIQMLDLFEAGRAVFALAKCIFFVDALMLGEIAFLFECCTTFLHHILHT